MKVLVAYAGKTGTTKKCAEYIKMISTEEVALYDAAAGGEVNIDEYDIVIMGGSIRIGLMDNSLRKFAKNNFDGKLVGLFVVCSIPENAEKYLRTNFPDIEPFAESYFGGELSPRKVKGIEKFVIKKALKESSKKNKPLPEVNYDEIKNFLEKLFLEYYSINKDDAAIRRMEIKKQDSSLAMD